MRVHWQGQVLHILDDEGVFMAVDSGVRGPMPKPNRPVREILARRGGVPPVRCRLVDTVDCTLPETHGFTDDGASRVLDLPGKRFRVTAAPRGFELKWFRYRIQTANRAGVPHLLVLETPNDTERYTTASLTVPAGTPWSPPYTGAEKTEVPDALALCQEPLWYEPDVGLSVYTGRELPIDNRLFIWHFLFYPKAAEMLCTISSSGWARPVLPETGGAVSRIWVFEILDPLNERRPRIQPHAGDVQRRIGVYTTHPWYYSAHYGVPPFAPAQRRRSYENLCDLMSFCGFNFMQFNVINGSDRAGVTWYPSRTGYYKQRVADLMSELPPVAAQRGIDLVPVVTSITAPDPERSDAPDNYGFGELSFQHHYNPKLDPRAFSSRAPDPLRPEVQDWLIRHLVEIAELAHAHGNITGIGFRVNGKIGTCYIAGEDKSGPETRVYSAEEMGYSTWNLAQFRTETGLSCPADSQEAYRWLKADNGRWDRWLDFRCRRTHAFWCRVRDAVRDVHPRLALHVLTDLPAEVLATNVLFPGSDARDARQVTRDLLRAHGYDPRLYTREEGMVIQRVMMVDMDRFFSKWGPPWGSNPQRYRDFHEQAYLPAWYRTPAGGATELYHTYWEEPFHPQGEFGPDGKGFGLRTATGMARGRTFFRPATFSVAAGQAHTIVLNGWERPVLGHEHDLRGFAQAFRALPLAVPEALSIEPVQPGLSAALYGDRIGVVNHAPNPVEARVTLRTPLPVGARLKDVSTGRIVVGLRDIERTVLHLSLDDWDLRTLVRE
jgi:hypothetical protein